MATYDTSAPAELLTGMRLARQSIGRGELVVIPTDTVYGVAADAFAPAVHVEHEQQGAGHGGPILAHGPPGPGELGSTGWRPTTPRPLPSC